MTERNGPPTEALALAGIVVRRPRRRGEADPPPVLGVPTLRVAAGERLSLLGPNGAGKTTLLHVAALLRRPDAGTVRIGGELATEANADRLRASLALLFQDPVLFAGTAASNAALGLRVRGVPRREAERQAAAWLERLGVAHLADRSRRALSGGEGQRVALARAFATGPRLLLLDEPFSALDAGSRAALLPELIAHLRAEGAAAVMVTHEPADAMTFGDRLAIVRDGRLVQVGPPDAVVAFPDDAATARLLGCAATIPGIARRCPEGGWRLAALAGEPVFAASAAPGMGDGDAAVAIVRAGAISVTRSGEPAPAGWNAIAARVTAVVPSPGGWRVLLRVGPDGETDAVGTGGWDRATLPDAGVPATALFPSAAVRLARPDARATTGHRGEGEDIGGARR